MRACVRRNERRRVLSFCVSQRAGEGTRVVSFVLCGGGLRCTFDRDADLFEIVSATPRVLVGSCGSMVWCYFLSMCIYVSPFVVSVVSYLSQTIVAFSRPLQVFFGSSVSLDRVVFLALSRAVHAPHTPRVCAD